VLLSLPALGRSCLSDCALVCLSRTRADAGTLTHLCVQTDLLDSFRSWIPRRRLVLLLLAPHGLLLPLLPHLCLLPLLLLLAPRELLLNAAPAASSFILAFVAAARYEVPSQLYPRIEKLQMPYVPNWCFSTPTPCFFKNGRLRLRTRTVPWYTVRTRNHSINRMKLIELIKWIRNVINHG
jgi:hypothetical protein